MQDDRGSAWGWLIPVLGMVAIMVVGVWALLSINSLYVDQKVLMVAFDQVSDLIDEMQADEQVVEDAVWQARWGSAWDTMVRKQPGMMPVSAACKYFYIEDDGLADCTAALNSYTVTATR